MQTDKDLADELRSGLASMAAHASVDMELWGYFSNDVLKAASRLEARSEVIAETSHNPLSSGEAVATDDVVRDMTGESVCGYRVAAWRETHPEHGDKFGHRYSEHWSTPSTNPAVKVERLFTESQLRAALSRPMPSREEVARKIDPEAWEEYLLEDGRVDEEVASIFQDAYEASLIKADAILSLFSSSLGGGLFAENAKKGSAGSDLSPASRSPDQHSAGTLHPATADLVGRFTIALRDKLAAAEAKYGHSDGWADTTWQEECRRQLHHHAAKGDPRDVAAYAAFCWHHGWPTTAPEVEGEE